jgi:hypothetical protein
MSIASTEKYQTGEKPLEFKIGLFWLHRLGIVSLVFGMVFLIMYSFNFFGPPLKLLTGFVVGLALILLGTRMASKPKQQWFGHGLTAGGWSVAYFTAYAAYYLPIVQMIKDLSLESILLLAVAGGSLISALRARSEIMAIYSITLAAASIVISRPGLMSDISFLIIAVTTSILGNRQAWRKLLAYGIASCYLGHIYCSSNATSGGDNVLASVFLGAIWLAFSIGLAYSVHDSSQARKFTTIVSCINSTIFAIGLLFFSSRGIAETGEILLTCAGAVYLLAANWLHHRSEHQLKTVHSMLGLSLINVAKLMHFSGLTLLAVDIAEIAFLGTIGAMYDIRSFRWFAVLLTLLLFPMWLFGEFQNYQLYLGFTSFPYFRLGLCATLALCALAAHHIRNQETSLLPTFYARFYYLAVNLMALMAFSTMVDSNYWACVLVGQAIVNHLIAARLADRFYAHPGTVCAIVAAIALASLSSWHTATTAVIVLLLYWAHSAFRLEKRNGETSLTASLQMAYAYGANIMLTLFLFRQLPVNYVSLGAGLEGICLLMIGFALNDRPFRICGLATLALLAGKLLFFDFAKFDTLERIVSFIATGIVFLLSSYGYARFTRSFEEEAPAEFSTNGTTGTMS